jgi:predicted amidohydrolase
MAKTKIACVQTDCAIGEVSKNLAGIVARLREAAALGAELVVFPECALTGYCFESLEEAAEFAEPAGWRSADAIAEACRETGAHAVVGFIERDGGRLYNAAMIVGPAGLVSCYRKAHLPFLGVDRFLAPGDRPFATHELPSGRVGVNICYDVSFPEASRVLKVLGAQLVALPTNWPPGAWRSPEFVVRARALENHVYYAAANRVGCERGWRFIGRSKIVDCDGETLAEASADAEEIITAEVDLSTADDNHIVNVAGAYEFDRMADRRPDLYRPISEPRAGRGADDEAGDPTAATTAASGAARN